MVAGVVKTSQRTKGPEETARLGAELAAHLKAGDVVALVGELGSGKTCFVRGLADGLGAKGSVKSPSYTIVNVYEGSELTLYHVDLYRIASTDEFYGAGIDELLNSGGVSVIEWADRVPAILVDATVIVRFSHAGEAERLIEIEPSGVG
jgi:tRNA threonylcarbamoyladenosine biosynthesis protein TsaE